MRILLALLLSAGLVFGQAQPRVVGPTGATTITTLGTVTTGTWNAGVIPGLYGGTGVANSGKTITLAGNIITTGAFNTTFAQQATSTITLPNSSTSTMARTDAGQTFTGVQVMASPAITTPAITGLATGSGVASAATASTLAARDASANLSANSLLNGYTTTATAAGTTTLTVASTFQQYFTGSTTQTVVLPVTSTLVLGQSFQIVNSSTGLVTVNSSGGNAVIILGGNTSAIVTCILTSGTDAASWSANYRGTNITSGKVLAASNTITLSALADATSLNIGAGSTGTQNVFLGASSGKATTSGSGQNVGIGVQALTGVTTGSANTCMGYNAGGSITTSTQNTAIGQAALDVISTQNGYNSAFGVQALKSCIGYQNVGFAIYAGNTITTGFNNICIGYAAGSPLTTGDGNTIVGTNATTAATGTQNATAIGQGATAASNVVSLGNTSVTEVNTSGNFKTTAIGSTLLVKSGTNAKSGTFTLVAGTVAVSNTSITANSVVVCALKTSSGTPGIYSPQIVLNAGTGFTANGLATDGSTYNYVVLEVN